MTLLAISFIILVVGTASSKTLWNLNDIFLEKQMPQRQKEGINMTSTENKELLETLYKEDLADKIYLSDEENEKLLNGNPDDIPADVYFEEIKEGEDVNKKYFRYSLVENCDSLLKMKLLKKSRLQLILTGLSLIVSTICLVLVIAILA